MFAQPWMPDQAGMTVGHEANRQLSGKPWIGHPTTGKPPYTFGDNRCVSTPNPHPPSELTLRIHQAITQAGGWIGFDRFMAMACTSRAWVTTPTPCKSSAPCPLRAAIL
jgi:hypothetical protein